MKSTSFVVSLLANRDVRERAADVALLCDGDEILESAEGNVFALVEHRRGTRAYAVRVTRRRDVLCRIGPDFARGR